MDHLTRVLDVLGAVLGVSPDKLDSDSAIGTVPGWDSMKHMAVILALEEELGISFTDDEIVQATSVSAIAELVARHSTG